MDTLFRGCYSDYFLRRHVRIWSGLAWGRDYGKIKFFDGFSPSLYFIENNIPTCVVVFIASHDVIKRRIYAGHSKLLLQITWLLRNVSRRHDRFKLTCKFDFIPKKKKNNKNKFKSKRWYYLFENSFCLKRFGENIFFIHNFPFSQINLA